LPVAKVVKTFGVLLKKHKSANPKYFVQCRLSLESMRPQTDRLSEEGLGTIGLFRIYLFQHQVRTMHSIKKRLADGQEVNVFSIGAIPSFKIIEMAAMLGGYHAVWIDEEHAGLTQREIEHLTLACRSAGLDSYVRIAPLNYAAVMRPMEAGVGGVMAAQIRSVDEARQIVSWAKFPPMGSRGINPSNFEANYTTRSLQEHIDICNRDRWLSVQIETLEALECVEQVAEVDGIDHLFVGPADLSVALGVPGQFLHADCKAALDRVSKACKRAGKSWGILVRGPEHAALCRDLGCQLFAFANDLSIVLQGFRAVRSTYSSFFSDSVSG
jgi:4-hydroxy-2-oxoheptanedioate aldolase